MGAGDEWAVDEGWLGASSQLRYTVVSQFLVPIDICALH